MYAVNKVFPPITLGFTISLGNDGEMDPEYNTNALFDGLDEDIPDQYEDTIITGPFYDPGYTYEPIETIDLDIQEVMQDMAEINISEKGPMDKYTM